MIRFILAAATAIAAASAAVAGPPELKRTIFPAFKFVPLAPAAKIAVLRKGGIVVRDLPIGPPRVTPAKPIVPGVLSVSFYSAFAVDAEQDAAMTQDGKGFIAINWRYDFNTVYLIDCQVSGPATIETALDGGNWMPAALSNGHLVFAAPGLGDNGSGERAFAFRNTKGGLFFKSCELTKIPK